MRRCCWRTSRAINPHPRLQVTVSLGFAHFDEADDDGLEMLNLVEQRLYEAKDLGPNRVVGPREGAEIA